MDLYYNNALSSSTQFPENNQYTIIDTGTSLIYVFETQYNAIIKFLSGITQCGQQEGGIICQCDETVWENLSSMQFNLSG